MLLSFLPTDELKSSLKGQRTSQISVDGSPWRSRLATDLGIIWYSSKSVRSFSSLSSRMLSSSLMLFWSSYEERDNRTTQYRDGWIDERIDGGTNGRTDRWMDTAWVVVACCSAIAASIIVIAVVTADAVVVVYVVAAWVVVIVDACCSAIAASIIVIAVVTADAVVVYVVAAWVIVVVVVVVFLTWSSASFSSADCCVPATTRSRQGSSKLRSLKNNPREHMMSRLWILPHNPTDIFKVQ